MPITNAQYTIAQDTRVKIASADNMPQQLTLRPGDELYAYSTQGAPVVHVLQIQNND